MYLEFFRLPTLLVCTRFLKEFRPFSCNQVIYDSLTQHLYTPVTESVFVSPRCSQRVVGRELVSLAVNSLPFSGVRWLCRNYFSHLQTHRIRDLHCHRDHCLSSFFRHLTQREGEPLQLGNYTLQRLKPVPAKGTKPLSF